MSTTPSARTRRTRGRVHITDALAGVVIRVGGVGVLAAVLGMCAYLVFAVLPLFAGGSLRPDGSTRGSVGGVPVLACQDEYRAMIVTLSRDGVLRALQADTGELLLEQPLARAGASAYSWESTDGLLAIGYEDGSVQLGSIAFATIPTPAKDLNAEEQAIGIGERRAFRRSGAQEKDTVAGVLERQGADQYRVIAPRIALRAPVPLEEGSGAVARLDYRRTSDREMLVAMRADGTTLFERVTTVTPLGGGAPRTSLDATPVRFEKGSHSDLPARVFTTGDGAHVLALWEDGTCQRYSLEAEGPAPLVETAQLLPAGRRVTASTMMIGGLTLLIGDDAGVVHGCFVARDPSGAVRDGLRLVAAHRLQVFPGSAIASLAVSGRNRCFAAQDARGSVSVWNLTGHKRVAESASAMGAGHISIAPKFDGLLAIDGQGQSRSWTMDSGHPEASWSTLFGRVHYEGEPAPGFSYQSSAASDSSEPKLSLVPLIHGSLKATLIAMLVAIPLALLAAVYTSEFMSPRSRQVVKPMIELMSSLPSVVLGFVAAIIVAPFISSVLAAVSLGLVLVPCGVLLAAHAWQLLPQRLISRWHGVGRTVAITGTLALGMLACAGLGPVLERELFRPTRTDVLLAAGARERVPPDQRPAWVGARQTMSPDEERRLRAVGLGFRDGEVVRAVEPKSPEDIGKLRQAVLARNLEAPSLRRWLDGNIGDARPGWIVLLFAPFTLVVWAAYRRWIARSLHQALATMGRTHAAIIMLGACAGLLAIAWVLTLPASWALSALGLDPRDLVLGPYSQRNTMVVGFIMGFAVIPIIYTIAEDALGSVPSSLRTASLGVGATRWQTTVRVVLPVAASGLFSAIMIGLGRAVGETMIVVMATGNTPSMDWNIFSGFRTLSANIAVELPEAAKDSTHYRVLFLCGLVLFALTFVINTLAEMVRQRFRRRNAAL